MCLFVCHPHLLALVRFQLGKVTLRTCVLLKLRNIRPYAIQRVTCHYRERGCFARVTIYNPATIPIVYTDSNTNIGILLGKSYNSLGCIVCFSQKEVKATARDGMFVDGGLRLSRGRSSGNGRYLHNRT